MYPFKHRSPENMGAIVITLLPEEHQDDSLSCINLKLLLDSPTWKQRQKLLGRRGWGWGEGEESWWATRKIGGKWRQWFPRGHLSPSWSCVSQNSLPVWF